MQPLISEVGIYVFFGDGLLTNEDYLMHHLKWFIEYKSSPYVIFWYLSTAKSLVFTRFTLNQNLNMSILYSDTNCSETERLELNELLVQ